MSGFFVNGQAVTVAENTKLLYYLRDTLMLTSVKNGCAEGACGTCTVLIDGKPVKSCVQQTDRLEGKHIVTLEGLSQREKDVFSYAFASCGAVQCGFCIPGMVISAKALIDQNPDPTRGDVREALRNNICRCTGYKKIFDAVLLAARMLREELPIPETPVSGSLGERTLRVDAADKALGTARYADDIHLPGMLYASAVRSAYPRAKILSIDSSEARALPGVIAVFTASDIPGVQKIGHIQQDYDVMIPVGKITHFLGDAIALVIAESQEILEKAKPLVHIDYEELRPIVSAAEAMSPGAPLVHSAFPGNLLAEQAVHKGNASDALANAKFAVTEHYFMPPTEHAFLEPECAVACPDGENGIRIFSGDQGIFQTRKECAAMLGLPAEQVRVTAMMVGGGFGGKEDMSVQHHAALAAWLLKRPVKVKLSRQESILIHPKRHSMEITVTTACDENGILTGFSAEITADTGAYASLGVPVLQRACTHAAGPYNYQNIDIIGRAFYTNNPPAGAFRGFGVAQSCFATECNLNLLAELVGISPFEIRYRNAIRPGQVLPNGQIADENTALVETLDAVRPIIEKKPRAGIACAIKNSGLGVGVPDIGRSRIKVSEGKVHLFSSAACIGQGMGTIQCQFVAEITGLPLSRIIYHSPDTADSPDSGNTTASRQTLMTGEAVVRAAQKLKDALSESGSLKALDGMEFCGEFESVTDPFGSDKANPVSHVAYSYATHVVELDEDGKLLRVTAAHDIGQPVNPTALEGQIEGGVVMGLGYALTEDFPLDHCKPLKKFGTLGLFRANEVPEVVPILVGHPGKSNFACGAKGVGEISAIPTAAAVQLAYYYRDHFFRTELPLKETYYNKK